MAAVAFSAISPSSSSSSTAKATTLLIGPSPHLSPQSIRFPPPSSPSSLSLSLSRSRRKWSPSVSALVEETQAPVVETQEEEAEEQKVDFKVQLRPCELYVCNLPRSCDITELVELFKPFGTVQSVEVSRNIETGVSRGCGFITMSSIGEARAAISTLDGSDLGGREICVKFSADMVSGRKNTAAQNTAPKKDKVFESPHKAYVGNLSWSVKPEDLREHFSQFGTVVSTRLLQDRKSGRSRVYGFLSFSSADELKAAVSSSGMEFHGRTMLVREIVNQ